MEAWEPEGDARVTRLFDALRKVQSAPARVVPPPPPVAPAIAVATTTPRQEGARRAAHEARGAIAPFQAAVELPTEVLREMTGLRVSLEVALTERIPRVVIFLASQGGEGTSTVAAQFAQTLSSDPRLRILLVDLHARHPRYAADGRPLKARHGGHHEPAAGGPPAAHGLDVLPLTGARLQQGAMSPQSLREILDAVGSGYDWIVLDGPPVLESPDATTLAAVADGILVVVQAGRTKRPVLARSVDLLRRAGGRVQGMVLNRRRLEIPGFIYRRL